MKRYDRPYTFFYLDPPYWKTEGYGVVFGFEQYEQMAEVMRTCKGKVMLNINDHPDIRSVFGEFDTTGLEIKYAISSTHGNVQASKELVIANWDASNSGGLF